jgi:hypothetical protein
MEVLDAVDRLFLVNDGSTSRAFEAITEEWLTVSSVSPLPSRAPFTRCMTDWLGSDGPSQLMDRAVAMIGVRSGLTHLTAQSMIRADRLPSDFLALADSHGGFAAALSRLQLPSRRVFFWYGLQTGGADSVVGRSPALVRAYGVASVDGPVAILIEELARDSPLRTLPLAF